MKLLALLIALAACEPHDILGTGWDFGGITSKVFLCDTQTGVTVDDSGTMRVDVWMTFELCWPGGHESLEASLVDNAFGDQAQCRPTPRHLGPCIYGCEAHSGCNATSGCFCPTPEEGD